MTKRTLNFLSVDRKAADLKSPSYSVLVIDGAVYPNIQEDKCPTMATNRTDILTWMNITAWNTLLGCLSWSWFKQYSIHKALHILIKTYIQCF